MSRFILGRSKIVTSESFHKKGVRSEGFFAQMYDYSILMC